MMNFLLGLILKLVITLAILGFVALIGFSAFAMWQDMADFDITAYFTQSRGIALYGKILGFVAGFSVIIAILTKRILGKGTEINGDFWEHQAIAKRKIAWLNALFFTMLAIIFISAFSLFQIVFHIFQPEFVPYDAWNPMNFYIENSRIYAKISLGLSCAMVGIVIVAYFIKSALMRNDSISALAKTLQATEITHSRSLTAQERVLINVIEEMALASNMPRPRVFVMQDERGINAMCSGENFGYEDERIAIFVTRGALESFNRNELQGVIGHEFSHAFHGDVALNLKIFSLVFALGCVMVVGETLIRSFARSGRNSKNSKGIAVVIAVGGIFYVLGFVGGIFAQIIQAAISRQKEYLADSSSVQYTRNPNGIKSALEKIHALQTAHFAEFLETIRKAGGELDSKEYTQYIKRISHINNLSAKPAAHMFFLSGFGEIFATHPSLESRIERLKEMS